jgi:hypothetical protein
LIIATRRIRPTPVIAAPLTFARLAGLNNVDLDTMRGATDLLPIATAPGLRLCPTPLCCDHLHQGKFASVFCRQYPSVCANVAGAERFNNQSPFEINNCPL